jgi:hypothetical protein
MEATGQREAIFGKDEGGEWIFRWVLTGVAVVMTAIPYLWYWHKAPPGHHYTWILPPYPEDSLAYMAWSQQAAHGNLLLKLKYTALPGSSFLFHPVFLLCGIVAGVSGCEIGVVHWAFKTVGVVLFFWVFFKHVSYLGLTKLQERIAAILVAFSSGLGGVLAFAGVVDRLPAAPTDLWFVDSNTYWSLLWNPLFPYSLTFTVLVLYWVDRGTREGRGAYLWHAGIAAGVLALIHPYSQPLLAAFAVVLTLVRRKKEALAYLARYFVMLAPFVTYVVLVAKLDPLVSQHSTTGAMKSPSLSAYLLGFGCPLLLWSAGLALAPGPWIRRFWPVSLWFVLSVCLAYVPTWYQRKQMFGAHVPLCIMAAIASDAMISKYLKASARGWGITVATVLLVPLLFCTPLYLFVQADRTIKANEEETYYMRDDLIQGFKFLREQSRPDDTVFATYETSRFIPGYSGNTVVWGHWAMSVDLEERRVWTRNIFDSESNWDQARRGKEFWGAGIRYIFADGKLRQWLQQSPLAPVILKDTTEVFTNGTVTIYRGRGLRG